MRSFVACLLGRGLKTASFVSMIGLALIAPGVTLAGGGAGDDAPFHCYLTWQGDPTTTITVNFQTVNPHASVEVLFDTAPHDGTPSLYPQRVQASTHEIPGLNDLPGAQRFIHTAELTGLTPGQAYYFVAGSPEGGYTTQRSVKITDRDLDELRFIDGGDMATSEFVPPLLEAAAAQSPQFAIIGGDIAYENGALENWGLWDQWLDNWETYMVTPEGFTIPLILAIGNHEVVGGFDGFDDPLARAPFYFGFFAQSGHGFDMPRSAYFRRDFGPEATLLILDSGHTTAVDGAHADWIAEQLAQLGEVDLRMAAYHVPMYPSHRGFNETRIAAVRSAWLPLFDAGGLDLAFEHHDHMLKRTQPLRENHPDSDGTVYLGDGCFGQTPRTGDQAIALDNPGELESLGLSENYLASWSPVRSFWLVETTGEDFSAAQSFRFRALDEDGNVVDDSTAVIDTRSGDGGFICIASVILGGAKIDRLRSLRGFRDARLLTSAPGAAFAYAYYRLSNPAAAWLAGHPRLLRSARAGAGGIADRFVIAATLSCIVGLTAFIGGHAVGRAQRSASTASTRGKVRASSPALIR